MANEFLNAALKYASAGRAVFPLKPRSKEPRTKNGVHDATTDADAIRRWWTKWPDSNIGMATGGPSSVSVIDCDIKADGTNGLDTLHNWECEHGELPETVRSITGKGGAHLFFKTDRPVRNRVEILPGIDIRGDGGYVVVPPSEHPNGRQYEYEYDPDEYEIAEADELVWELLNTGKKTTDKSPSTLPETIPEHQRNDTIFRLACSLQSKGLSDETIMMACLKENALRCSPQLDEDEVRKTVDGALKRYGKGAKAAAGFRGLDLLTVIDKDKNEKVRQCSENMFRVMQQDEALADKIKYDTFNCRPMYLGQLPWRDDGDTYGEWTDGDDAALRNYLDIRYGLNRRTHYDDAFQLVLMVNRYNPLTGYLDALQWDGKSRVGSVMTEYLGVEPTEYNVEAYRTFLQGAIHRAYDPGCKFDLMLILIGRQAAGKSTFLKYHALQDDWYVDNYNFRSTDSKAAVESMAGKWILEMSEMDTMKKDSMTADAMKAFITSQADVYRTPYDRRPITRKRSCVFCGSTNDGNFLKDRTGNRRFLPIDVHPELATRDIFDEAVARKEIEQVLAEAVAYYKANPTKPPVLPKHIAQAAIDAQYDHLEQDVWVDLITEYLDRTSRDRINATCIWQEGFRRDPVDMKRAESSRILTILRHDVKGWHEIGKHRISGFGNSSICFEKDLPDTISGFTEIDDDETIPF